MEWTVQFRTAAPSRCASVHRSAIRSRPSPPRKQNRSGYGRAGTCVNVPFASACSSVSDATGTIGP